MRAPMMMHPAGDAGFLQNLIDSVASFFSLLDLHAGWEAGVAELAAPHMAVLVHKRARLLDADPMRWAKELGEFVDSRIWPHLDAAGQAAGRAKVFELLDESIARKAAALAAAYQQTPLTSRFDDSWAG